MTAVDAQKKFEELKTRILEDKKIDITEANILIEFINQNIKDNNNKMFNNFKDMLMNCADDDVITDDESESLVIAIEDISKFLKKNAVIEHVCMGLFEILSLACFLALVLAMSYAIKFIMKFL